ncbi:MAG: site-2 protease family protein [Clostridia bacterium]|nr:site-2 protease family protein [Clostridia bacterium]
MNLLATAAEVWETIGGIALAIVILLAMVTIHEFGHYLAGKILGFKITEFSVGFGPAILKKRSKRTGELFALRIIPLGGYCAFDGEDFEEEGQTPPQAEPFEETQNEAAVYEVSEPQTESKTDEYPEPKGAKFTDQPPWKRIIVLVSGAIMNYLLALVLLIIMTATYGVPMCIAMPANYTNDQAQSVPHAAWDEPALSARDVLLEIDGVEIAMITDCIDALKGKSAGETVSATVLRYAGEEKGWQEKEVTLTLLADGEFEDIADVEKIKTVAGISVWTTTMRRDFWHTIGGAFAYSGEMATSVLRTLGELLTGGIGMEAVGGPVSTITMTAQAATASPFSFLYIASFIGVNLAVFNLLPVPALDGCKVIFCIIEWIRKKPVNRKVETIIHFVGIVALLGFAILVDLLKLF